MVQENECQRRKKASNTAGVIVHCPRSIVSIVHGPRSKLANGGVYVMDRRIRDLLPSEKPADIAFDLVPRCMGEMYGWRWDGLLFDIGSPAAYRAAQRMMATEGRMASAER